METTEFTSPARKLILFFKRSRDAWKQKCMDRKAKAKLLSNDLRAVKKSRDKWKEAAKEERRRVKQLERELSELKSQVC